MVLDDPGAAPQARDEAPWQHDKKKHELEHIGKPIRKVDARSKVSGLTQFADDMTLPRMLHMKLLRSTKAHAEIVSIDTSKAEQLAGVKGVLTGKDMPTPFGILPVSQDEHALCPDQVRFVGDPVVAIAATEEETAWDACRLVDVEYRELRTIGGSPNAFTGSRSSIPPASSGNARVASGKWAVAVIPTSSPDANAIASAVHGDPWSSDSRRPMASPRAKSVIAPSGPGRKSSKCGPACPEWAPTGKAKTAAMATRRTLSVHLPQERTPATALRLSDP